VKILLKNKFFAQFMQKIPICIKHVHIHKVFDQLFFSFQCCCCCCSAMFACISRFCVLWNHCGEPNKINIQFACKICENTFYGEKIFKSTTSSGFDEGKIDENSTIKMRFPLHSTPGADIKSIRRTKNKRPIQGFSIKSLSFLCNQSCSWARHFAALNNDDIDSGWLAYDPSMNKTGQQQPK
jgi:hypothetical protein